MPVSHTRFAVTHKVDNVGIFVLLNSENKLDNITHHFNFHSKNYDKCNFLLKLIQVETISNFLPLEVVRKYQHCKFCALRENLIN